MTYRQLRIESLRERATRFGKRSPRMACSGEIWPTDKEDVIFAIELVIEVAGHALAAKLTAKGKGPGTKLRFKDIAQQRRIKCAEACAIVVCDKRAKIVDHFGVVVGRIAGLAARRR